MQMSGSISSQRSKSILLKEAKEKIFFMRHNSMMIISERIHLRQSSLFCIYISSNDQLDCPSVFLFSAGNCFDMIQAVMNFLMFDLK
jgi:hypothetical protein